MRKERRDLMVYLRQGLHNRVQQGSHPHGHLQQLQYCRNTNRKRLTNAKTLSVLQNKTGTCAIRPSVKMTGHNGFFTCSRILHTSPWRSRRQTEVLLAWLTGVVTGQQTGDNARKLEISQEKLLAGVLNLTIWRTTIHFLIAMVLLLPLWPLQVFQPLRFLSTRFYSVSKKSLLSGNSRANAGYLETDFSFGLRTIKYICRVEADTC